MTATVTKQAVIAAARKRWPGMYPRVKVKRLRHGDPNRCWLFVWRADGRTSEVSISAPTLGELLAKIEGDK